MPKKISPKKRTAQIVPRKSTKKHAAIVKKVPPTTLITGGTGFLGAHLVRQLVESGVKDLRVMANSTPEWLADLGVDTVAGSVLNADDVARAVEGVTEIYHLAGKVSREKDDAREMYRLHVEGTRLFVVESGFASLPPELRTHESHVEGWQRELGDLAQYLAAP